MEEIINTQQSQQPSTGGVAQNLATMLTDPNKRVQFFLGLAGSTGGDFAKAANYMSAFDSVLGLNPEPPSVTQQEKMSLANQGLQALDRIENSYSNANAIQRRLPNVFRLGGGRRLDAATTNAADILGRLRSGAQVTQEEEARFRELLPRFGDDEQTRQQKLSILRGEFATFL